MDQSEIPQLRQSLLTWWKNHARDFPWRKTKNPYNILIAEVLLHRTRADQVVPIYNVFISKYPTLKKLATASSNDVQNVLFPLGLRWRSNLLLKMASELDSKYSCKIPNDKEHLLQLPGISEYIASALRCFSYGCSEPILDTNTVRIIGRLYGLNITDGSRRSKKFRQILEQLIPENNCDDFNFALLDLAALVCKTSKPRCIDCPISVFCDYPKH